MFWRKKKVLKPAIINRDDTYESITTKNFRDNVGNATAYQFDFVHRLMNDFPHIIKHMQDCGIKFKWDDTDQGRCEVSTFDWKGKTMSVAGSVALHFYQEPSKYKNVFPAFLNVMAKILEQYWPADITQRLKDKVIGTDYTLEEIKSLLGTSYNVTTVYAYDGAVGYVYACSLADLAELTTGGNKINVQCDEHEFVMHDSFNTAYKKFLKVAYKNDVCLFERVDHYDSLVGNPNCIFNCNYGHDDIESEPVVYVGGRLSGVEL